jgi:Trk K+ transport system NAD-binding subunit
MLRRLRVPLITLIVVYSISILGFVLIPGQDDQGNVWRMGFFHATYFVSFMGSTIGFGEIPYAFTDAQRMWTLIMIYATVVAWLYGIGSMLTLLQEPLFARLMHRRTFTSDVAGIAEPFYLICGYGVTGRVVTHKLTHRDVRAVVIDLKQERIDDLEMDFLPIPVPGLCADAALPDVLYDAGLKSPQCIGVLALTNDDSTNLAISIASKLLVPQRMVISRTESTVTTANLLSFGTDLVVDPFQAYAHYLSMAVHSPYKHLVYDWLVNPYHRPFSSAYQQTQGRWIICGYGRFGQALYRAFKESGVEVTVIHPAQHCANEIEHQVLGVGTEALTLEMAGITSAVGIVAGTDNDANNLSIIMTARQLKPKLVTVVRQNLEANKLIFSNSAADFIMEPGRIIANQIMAQIKTPMLPAFIEALKQYDDVWAHTLLNRMSSVVGEHELDSWAFTISESDTPAVAMALHELGVVKMNIFLKDPRDRKKMLPVFPLMLRRGEEIKMLPGELKELQFGDEILFCGLNAAFKQVEWTVNNYNVLQYILTGKEMSNTIFSRFINKDA